MERDQYLEELRLPGLCGVYKEAFNLVQSWRNIFSQITMALILPLSFIFSAQSKASELLFTKILFNEEILYGIDQSSAQILYQIVTFFLFQAAVFLFAIALALLTTSTNIFALSCIYTIKELTFKRVINIIAGVWKRLLVTFLWYFLTMLGYNILTMLIGIPLTISVNNSTLAIILLLLSTFYLVGFAYVNALWHLASVTSILEDTCGIDAMIKSKALIKGKMWMASVLFIKLHMSFLAMQITLQKISALQYASIGSVVCYVVLCFSFLTMLCQYIVFIQTAVYFICKSFHHENNISKSCLADHLESHLGKYMHLKVCNAQTSEFFDHV
ncbi:hypothetical protein Sjap_021757 [Stephania japonica]|uniref:Uncharacterized protein n=1 Tax=Stephania japonica TaxID=461633 RepID=A0AAP0EQ62_9MAGN